MQFSSSDKALLISTGGACFLVLVFFFLGVEPYQGDDVAEQFIEIPMITESLVEEEELEVPETVSRQLSNQAYNANQLQNELNNLDDNDEVRKAMEARQLESVEDLNENNNERLEALKKEREKAAALKKEETKAQIEEREAKRNQKKESKYKQSTISYNLVDRIALELPNPVYTCAKQGKLVINITVNNLGDIISKKLNSTSSTSSNGCLIDQAMKYLEQAHFNRSVKEKQLGTVTFIFQG